MTLLNEIIEIPSISCVNSAYDMSNLAVIELLADWFASAGFQIEIMPVPDLPGKANLIATLGQRSQGNNGLVLSGHTDTVPIDQKLWDTDPFKLTHQQHRFYGLGIADMKCFFPIILSVLPEIDLSKLKHPLIILATADEETTMSGARALIQSDQQLAKHALIGEPTGLIPIYAHKGLMSHSIKIFGKAGHSSDPANGVSALEGLTRVIDVLVKWRQQMQQEYQQDSFRVPYPTMNFGYIHGGDNPNRICSLCEVQFDLRILPGMHAKQISDAIESEVKRTIDGTQLSFQMTALCDPVPAFVSSPESEIVKLTSQLTGADPETVAFGTEAPLLQQLHCDTVVLGPGNIAQAHQANEYLSETTIIPMQNIIRETIKKFCY